jgi:hypothetical protein
VKFHLCVLNPRRTGLAVAIALALALGTQLGASADDAIAVAPMSQQDGAWAAARLGTSPSETIGSAGCAITAVAMLLRYYGIDTDPGRLNAWLTANGGYAWDDQLIWNAITAYTGGRVVFTGWFGFDPSVVYPEFNAGRPVIAEVSLAGNQHFVLLRGDTPGVGVVMNDPWFGDYASFAARYGYPTLAILSIRTFRAAEPTAMRVDGRMSWLSTASDAEQLAR